MICHLCGADKLYKEFPFEPLTEHCDHALLHCLRCVTKSVKTSRKCSQCDSPADENNAQYHKYIAKLNLMFPEITDDNNADSLQSSSSADGSPVSYFMVITLSGECITLEYNPNLTIHEVKVAVQKKLGTPTNKQLLLYEDTELKATNQNNNKDLKLSDYNVKADSTLNLLVLLYSVPEGFDNVVFDLFWSYPHAGKDYLDASALLYSGQSFVEVVDYRHMQSASCKAVRHSGDVMDDAKRIGHHTINVSIKSIPAHINKLVFTLSAWNSPNISKYPNPSLRFYEEKFPEKQLCSDEMTHAARSQAVIMCCLSNRDGQWQVFSLKNTSAGNARNYEPLKTTIVRLIKQGYI